MKFEDICNNIVVVASIGVAVTECYKTYLAIEDLKAQKAADLWEREAGARLNCMIDHAYRNRISKAGMLEALNAAKNVLNFEVDEVLPGNVHGRKALNNLHRRIDAQIKDI